MIASSVVPQQLVLSTRRASSVVQQQQQLVPRTRRASSVVQQQLVLSTRRRMTSSVVQQLHVFLMMTFSTCRSRRILLPVRQVDGVLHPANRNCHGTVVTVVQVSVPHDRGPSGSRAKWTRGK